MPYATNPDDGVRIYYEVEGDGPPLVMLHGLSSYANHWRELGYVDELCDRYRLTLVDSRGHGSSDKPLSADAYARRQQTRDVVAVLDEGGFESVHFWGYSFGAWIGYQVGASYPERFRSMILGAQHPYSYPEDKEWLREYVPPILRDVEQEQGVDAAPYFAGLEALLADDGFADELDRITFPLLAYAGDEDQMSTGAKRAACAIPGASFFSTGRAEHGGDFFDTSLILPVAKAFLDRVEADRGKAGLV